MSMEKVYGVVTEPGGRLVRAHLNERLAQVFAETYNRCVLGKARTEVVELEVIRRTAGQSDEQSR